jgi:hypothetical protein
LFQFFFQCAKLATTKLSESITIQVNCRQQDIKTITSQHNVAFEDITATICIQLIRSKSSSSSHSVYLLSLNIYSRIRLQNAFDSIHEINLLSPSIARLSVCPIIEQELNPSQHNPPSGSSFPCACLCLFQQPFDIVRERVPRV